MKRPTLELPIILNINCFVRFVIAVCQRAVNGHCAAIELITTVFDIFNGMMRPGLTSEKGWCFDTGGG
jgi:hypothetical protein